MQEWGIFNDEAEDFSAEQAVEAGFYSEEEANEALQRYSSEDECYVHKIEEPDEESS